MSHYHAAVKWRRDGADFLAGRYSRVHEIVFDGATVTGSASTGIVHPPYASEDAVDPEELFVASIATCHFLWFLDVAKHAGVTVESYLDEAEGVLGKGADGKLVMTEVTLRPLVICDASPETLEELHHKAHGLCFIANSVKTEVKVEPREA